MPKDRKKYDRIAQSALLKFERKIIKKLNKLDAGGKVYGKTKSYYINGTCYPRFTIKRCNYFSRDTDTEEEYDDWVYRPGHSAPFWEHITIRRNRKQEEAIKEYITKTLNVKYRGRYVFSLESMRIHAVAHVQIEVMWYEEYERRQAHKRQRDRLRYEEYRTSLMY